MIKNRRIILWGAVALVILASAGGWRYGQVRNQTTLEKPQDTAPVASNIAGSSLTHSQAVIIFAKERVQFGENCDVTPRSISIKSGATLMFDNRSRDAIEFKLDDVSYTLLGYGFRLLQLKSTKLPHTVEVDCGNGQGAGEIILK